jgi:Domain of unknown function (DUF4158)
MARSILSDAERLAWERFPQDPDPDVIAVYFTLADGEVDELRRLPTPAGRLATAIAVAAIRWLGFVPAELEHAPTGGPMPAGRAVEHPRRRATPSQVAEEWRGERRCGRARWRSRASRRTPGRSSAPAAELEREGRTRTCLL